MALPSRPCRLTFRRSGGRAPPTVTWHFISHGPLQLLVRRFAERRHDSHIAPARGQSSSRQHRDTLADRRRKGWIIARVHREPKPLSPSFREAFRRTQQSSPDSTAAERIQDIQLDQFGAVACTDGGIPHLGLCARIPECDLLVRLPRDHCLLRQSTSRSDQRRTQLEHSFRYRGESHLPRRF